MGLADVGKPKRRMDFNSSIDYLLGNSPIKTKKPKPHTSLKKPRVEVIKYSIKLTTTEKIVLIVEVILVIWFILAKLKILPFF